MTYTAKDSPRWWKRSRIKSVNQLLDDYEQHAMDATYKDVTVEYLHAALMTRAAEVQQRWAIVAAVAACLSVAVAVAALIVAVN
jgi:uncharacterized membrane protein YbaN (DUF454 family)